MPLQSAQGSWPTKVPSSAGPSAIAAACEATIASATTTGRMRWALILQSRPEVEGFGPRQLLVADPAQAAAAAGILHPGPGQRRIEIVAAVHEPGAGGRLVADADRRVLVHRPDRRGEAEGVVVHQADRLVVGAHPHHADHRAEAFVLHDRVAVV